MKLILLAIVSAAVGSISAKRVGNQVTINHAGRGDKCGTSNGIGNVDQTINCGKDLECVNGFCQDKFYLSGGVRDCIQSLRNMGVNVQLGDAAYYKGYCYTTSCHDMYDKINSCNDPEGYCGSGCQYCIKTDNRKCERPGGILAMLGTGGRGGALGLGL